MKRKVAIIFGGKSAEHEVSLSSASTVYNEMDTTKFIPLLLGVDKKGNWFYNTGYGICDIDLTVHDYFEGATGIYLSNASGTIEIVSKSTHAVLESLDVVFPIIHGTGGEDGTLQGFLRTMDIPFVGPDVLGSAIAMDKDLTKRLLRDASIPIARYYILRKHNPSEYAFEEIAAALGLPLFVKPANAGSSVGVTKVMDADGYKTAISTAFLYDNKILIEEAVTGKEVECAVLGNEEARASGVGEIVPTVDFYSYDAKYIDANGAKLRIPADIDETVSAAIRELAVKAFKTVGCEGMARVDFFLTKENRYVLNELNTLPGFTSISMYPKLWEQMGVSCRDLITELIDLALRRYERDGELLTNNV